MTFAILATVSWAGAASAQPSRLVVLEPTGEVRDGLPVMVRAGDPERYDAALSRGYSGHLLAVYAAVQQYLARVDGRRPEPAYLALTSRTGGFPEVGLVVDGGAKPDAGWVDLRRTSRLSGHFGAMDQIFPHELWHVLVKQLAGGPAPGHSRQVHAIGVRTDPETAFQEGLAEHAQVLAIDDAGALPETAALRDDAGPRRRAEDEIAGYAREWQRRWWPIRPHRLRMPLWFSSAEQVLRYDAVKANTFGHAAAVPEALLDRDDLEAAYWWRAIVPPSTDAAWRPAAVQWSTDGPVAHFFWRLMTDPRLGDRPLPSAIAREFGVDGTALAPVEAVALKLCAVLHAERPATTAAVVRAWGRVFPEDAADLDRIARAALGGQPVPQAPEIWLASERLMVGTSVFDQFRALPQPHTFDANAATVLDWLTMPGVDRARARRLVDAVPFTDLDDLARRSGLSPEAVRAAASGFASANGTPDEADLSLTRILTPYLVRWSLVFLVSALVAWAALGTMGRRAFARRWSAGLAAGTASLLVMVLAWVVVSDWWMPLAGPAMVCGLPWWSWRAMVRRRPSAAPILAWLVAAMPAFVLTR